MATIFKRKLDLAPTATVDTVALNNKVVSMREVVKQARVHTIHKMTKKIKKLRGKKGTDDQKKQNSEKAGRLVQEIKVIQMLKADYVSKYALGSTDKHSIIVCKPNAKMETRALARLAEHAIIQKVVKEFREKHSDWKDLAAYLMTKHTSREFKKKDKQKMIKVATNVQATETIIQTYLEEKLGLGVGETGDKNTDEQSEKQRKSLAERLRNISDGNVNAGNNDKHSDSGLKTKGKSKKLSERLIHIAENIAVENDVDLDSASEASEHSDEEENSGNIHECDDSESEGTSDNCSSVTEQGRQQSSSSDSGSVDTKSKQEPKETKNNNKDSLTSKTKMKVGDRADKVVSKPIVMDKVVGEMIVKKIDLSSFEPDDTDTIAKDKEIPLILLESDGTKKEGHKRKKKDAFFDTGEDDGDDSSDNGDVNEDSGAEDDKDLDYSGPGKHFQTNRSVDTKGDMHRGLKALSTTFLGSLSSNKMMSCKDSEFRSNEDWKRIRHEIKDKKLTSERGRGRGNYRGRGGFHGDQRGGRGGHVSRGAIQVSRGRGAHRPMDRGAPLGPRQFHRGDGRAYRNEHKGSAVSEGPRRGRPMGGGGGGDIQAEKVHPSWEASRKRKEQQTAVQAFQGKKIRFDDD